ncbi:MAG: hypothetical protein PHV34_18465 [Verrucomicrobiae bacterium]|nr:hypothetical protein [Verrucomicrobiae bacterium]
MKKIFYIIAVYLFLLRLAGRLWGATDSDVEEKISVSFKDITTSEVVDELRQRFCWRINFDAVLLDRKTMGITYQDYLAFWQTKDPAYLTEERKKSIEAFKVFVAKMPEKRQQIAGCRDRLFNFQFSAKRSAEPDSILDALVKANDQYAWKKSNQSYIVYAKDRQYPVIPRFILTNADFITAEDALYKNVLLPMGLTNTASAGKPDFSPFGEGKSISLNLTDADLYTCLTRFAEAFGSNVVWNIKGISVWRMVDGKPKGFPTVGFEKVDRIRYVQ